MFSATAIAQRLAAAPERALAALMLAQIAFWTLAPLLSHTAPPLDVVEMHVWGREWVVATFKHPNLPGLILEPTRLAFGAVGWPAYLISQISIALTFWAVFMLGRELMDGPRALAGTLLLTGIYFFSWVTPEFNHNVAQMPLWALVMLLLWRASTHGRWLNWLLLGLAAGLSLWAKYSSGVLLIVCAAWMLWDGRARARMLTPGPWITAAAAIAVAMPQILWLAAHDFEPFAYAARRAGGGEWWAPIEFLLTLLLDHLPMFVLLGCAGFFGKAADDGPPRPDARAMRYLLLLGLGPALLTALGALMSGAGLRSSWGAPMVVLSGLIAVALLSARFSPARLKRLGIGAGVLIVVVSGLYYAHMAYGPALTGKPLRGNWPQAEISAQLEAAWRAETDAPLRIVAGDVFTAGMVGLAERDPPSVLIQGDFATSPWITPERLAREGALLVWRSDDPPPDPLMRLAQGREVRNVAIPYRRFPNVAPLLLNYAIVPPQR